MNDEMKNRARQAKVLLRGNDKIIFIMTHQPTADTVAKQYERWRYPTPIENLDVWLQGNWERFDPVHAHRLLWPDREYQPDLDILIAGCGTNQAAVFAYTNPKAKVVAVDISQPSLDHQQHLKEKYGLWNLELHRLAIEEIPSLNLDFDLIVSTGVLHHLADPIAGLKALAACARPEAAIGIMLYAKYGRIGVQMAQSIFHDLNLRQDEESVAVVREVLSLLPQNHPLRSYLGIARDLTSDAALVDTFLHARERDYTVDDCLELVEDAGLVFQSWLLNAPYYLHDIVSPPRAASAAVHALPQAAQWSVMERIYPTNACHFFIACRSERPKESYVIDFAESTFGDYIPHMHKTCGLSGAEIFRSDWRMKLNSAQLPFVQMIDGKRSIREITDAVAQSTFVGNKAELSEFARRLFQSLWQLDFVSMGTMNSSSN